MIRYGYFLGLDLGEVKDFTAFAAVQATGDPSAPIYRLVGLERFKADTNIEILHRASDVSASLSYWDKVIVYIARHLRSHAFYRNSVLGIDATGIGRPVVWMIQRSPLIAAALDGQVGSRLIAFEFRGAGAREYQRQNGIVQVTRRTVLSSVQIVMGQGRLKIPRGLAESAVLTRELLEVRADESQTDGSEGRSKEHDDMVFAVAIAVHMAERITQQGVGGWMPLRYQ